MPRLMFPGTGRIKWCTTITSKSAPAITEINAGVELTTWLRQDGINRSLSPNETDVADATDTFNKTDVGTFGAACELTFLRDSVTASDTAFATLQRGTRGYLVVAPFGFGTGAGTTAGPVAGAAATAGNRVEVWPAVVSAAGAEAEGPNKAQVFKVTFALPDSPNINATAA